ncbi:hypothetical protein MW887_002020 [Aspergillus wentii]|nr:hypothetical protein MW887_002020 [Aspergillus wentii]
MSVADTRYRNNIHNMPQSPSKDDANHRPPPPPIPPSPTLTNPDMILPCDEGERESSTPSPPFNLPSLSNLQSFYAGQPMTNDFGADSNTTGTDTPIGLAWSLSNSNRSQRGNFPRHTWTHEGHDSSRRLSDIGEEDASSPSYLGGFPANLQAGSPNGASRLAASPVLHGRMEDNEVRQAQVGNWSNSSGSTISAASESSQRDGSTGQSDQVTGHSLHMGVNDVKLSDTQGKDTTPRSSIVSVAGAKGPGEELSSVILSTEAERILENAKKRLTLMEGNLTRARSSMRASPSLSSSPSPSGNSPSLGPHQPVGGLYRSISHTNRRGSLLRPRSTYNSAQDAANNRHSRVHSETNLHSTGSNESNGLSRSLSAMASSSSIHNDDKSFRYDPSRAYLTHRSSTSSFQPVGVAIPNKDTPPDTPKGLGISTDASANANSSDNDNDNETKISSMEDFNTVYPSYDPPSRTQSQLQVRDLQDQMKGLHIKISSLKVKTQEDNLRRRSLQSLRTPSPFTAANHWYSNMMEYKHSQETLNSSSGASGQRRPPGPIQEVENKPEPEPEPEPEPVPELEPESEPVSNGYEVDVPAVTISSKTDEEPEVLESADFDDGQSVMESLYEDAEEGEYDTDGSNESIDREALNEILREPLDEDLRGSFEDFPPVPPIPDTGARPHEEREDAFDYEHFILHSALGNYSQSKMRRASNLSNASVETTRPIHEHRSAKHSRTNSTNSLSTIASFATATEGERDDGIRSVLYWDRKFNDELRNNDHYHENGHISEESDTEAMMGTPRAARKAERPPSLAIPHRSDSATTGSATPTSLASSLVSTVRAASSPHPNQTLNAGINNDDERLLEQLFESLGSVCMDLQAITTAPDPDPKAVRVLRRRLDAARRVLDGELDT